MSGVGYYVHHHGSGHANRATAVAGELHGLGVEVTGLSSAPRPAGWPGQWVVLAHDDDPAVTGHVARADADVTAHGRLHWVPLRHPGLSRRAAQLSAWFDATRPDVLVTDVSQEVSLLARLHGVPVVSVVLPGRRDDPAHALGLGISAAVVSFWPPEAHGMVTGLPADVTARLRPLGGLSRYAPEHAPEHAPEAPRGSPRPRTGRVVVMAGTGGGSEVLAAAAASGAATTPDLAWRVLGPGSWSSDPWAALRGADVVVTAAGQNSLAEVAAARVPAVVVPQVRPHDEQRTTGRALADERWPALVVDDPGTADWARLVTAAADLDGGRWAGWVDGGAAARMADLVLATGGGAR